MKLTHLLLASSLLAAYELAAQPSQPLLEPTWDRATAEQQAAAVDITPWVNQLLLAAQAEKPNQALQLISTLEAGSSWPWPAREKALFEAVTELRNFSAGSVSPQVLQRLKTFSARTLVRDETHPRNIVALYPVSVAAHGLGNHWAREAAGRNALAWLDGIGESAAAESNNSTGAPLSRLKSAYPGVERLFDQYLSSNNAAEQLGFEDAIGRLGAGDAEQFLLIAGQFRDPNRIAPLHFQAALVLGDAEAISDSLNAVQGERVTDLLRQAAASLPQDAAEGVLFSLLDSAEPTTKAIAVAVLGPGLEGQESQMRLMGWLSDPLIGSTIALNLARWGTDSTRTELKRRASESDSMALKRALDQAEQERRYAGGKS